MADYIKIIKAIDRKKEAKGMLWDEPYHAHAGIPKDIGKGLSKKIQRTTTVSEVVEHNDYNSESEQVHEKKEHKKKEKEFGLSEDEFVNIQFDLDWPLIVKDLSTYMVGLDLLKGTRISEADELIPQNFQQEMCKDSDLNKFRQSLKINEYCYALNTFRTLEGKENKARKKADIDKIKDQTATYVETNLFLEEHHFVKNIDKVFDNAPPFFGKMLYIWMAKGFDKVKISFLRFMECLYPLFNLDNRFNHNKIAFQLMDIDRDNTLNVLNLLHL